MTDVLDLSIAELASQVQKGALTARQVTEAAIKVAAEITAATLAPLTADEQRILARVLKKLG